MPSVTLDGQPLHYTHIVPTEALAGKRPPLLLVHGAGGNLYHWPPHLRRLAGVEVYALDLPGHGRSAGPGRATIDDYVQVIHTFAEALTLPPFVLAGHSMGGAIALAFALHYADQLAGLVLVSTGARLRVNAALLDGLRHDFDTTTAQLIDWMYRPAFDAKARQKALDQLRTNDPQTLFHDFVACNAFDVRTQVTSLALPTLIICGVADKMTPVVWSEALHQAMVGSQLQLVEEAGHMVMVEQPAAVTAAFQVFMTINNRTL